MMNEIESSTQESAMKKQRKIMKGGHTKPKGKQVAGQRYKSGLTPMAIPAAKKAHKTIRYKKTARKK